MRLSNIQALKTACRILTRLPVTEKHDTDVVGAVPFFPVIGVFLGLGMCLVAWILVVVTGLAVGSILGAVALPLLLWWVTGWRNLTAVVGLIENRFDGGESTAGAASAHSALYWRISMFHAFVLLRWLCVGGLIYQGGAIWLLIAPVLSCAAFGEMCYPAAVAGAELDGKPLSGPRHLHWLIAAVVVLVGAGFAGAFFAGVAAVIFVVLLIPWMERAIGGERSSTVERSSRAAMELIEQGILVLGVLYSLGR